MCDWSVHFLNCRYLGITTVTKVSRWYWSRRIGTSWLSWQGREEGRRQGPLCRKFYKVLEWPTYGVDKRKEKEFVRSKSINVRHSEFRSHSKSLVVKEGEKVLRLVLGVWSWCWLKRFHCPIPRPCSSDREQNGWTSFCRDCRRLDQCSMALVEALLCI